MATVPRMPQKSSPRKPGHPPVGKEQLRRDRIHAVITVLLLVAAFALVALLAGLAPTAESVDYRPWLP